MKKSNSGVSILDNQSSELKPAHRNMLTFTEAWDQVFERAISKDKLYAEVRAGHIPHTKIGTKIIFRRDTLKAWFGQQESKNFTKDTLISNDINLSKKVTQ
jgi:excisionase family DNA binding protein